MGAVTPFLSRNLPTLKGAEDPERHARRFLGNLPVDAVKAKLAHLPPRTILEETRTKRENQEKMKSDPFSYGDLGAGSLHPSLAFAGLGVKENMMYWMCAQEQKKGIHLVPAGIGRNLGPTHSVLHKAEDRLLDAYLKAGNRPLVLVGHSLGGLTALYLAAKYPHMVRMVITLGSPVASSAQEYGSTTSLVLAHEMMKLIHHVTKGKVLHRDVLHHTRPEHEREFTDYARVFIGAEKDRVVEPLASVLMGSGPWTSLMIPGINHAGLPFDPTVVSIISRAITLDPELDLVTSIVKSRAYETEEFSRSGNLLDIDSGVLSVKMRTNLTYHSGDRDNSGFDLHVSAQSSPPPRALSLGRPKSGLRI